MTVKDLRKALAGVPDSAKVVEFSDETWLYYEPQGDWGVRAVRGRWSKKTLFRGGPQLFECEKDGPETVVVIG